MNAGFDNNDPFPTTGSTPVCVTVIYEDFASGARARRFAAHLADGLECSCSLAESIWRTELLECPPLADAAARAAEGCEYLIISLRGDHVVPFATRQWLEAQLDSAAERGAWVIGLLGSDHGKPRVLEGNRSYLRGICAAKRVDFFSLAAMRDPAGLLPDDDAAVEVWEPRWMETLLHAS